MRLTAVVLVVLLAAACGKPDEPKAVPAPAQVEPKEAPPAQQVGESCSKDCGGGVVASITCAAGETPVCDCAATPKAGCRAAEPSAP